MMSRRRVNRSRPTPISTPTRRGRARRWTTRRSSARRSAACSFGGLIALRFAAATPAADAARSSWRRRRGRACGCDRGTRSTCGAVDFRARCFSPRRRCGCGRDPAPRFPTPGAPARFSAAVAAHAVVARRLRCRRMAGARADDLDLLDATAGLCDRITAPTLHRDRRSASGSRRAGRRLVRLSAVDRGRAQRRASSARATSASITRPGRRSPRSSATSVSRRRRVADARRVRSP